MKKANILTAAVLLSLLGSTVAFADDHWRRDYWNNGHGRYISEKQWEKEQERRARAHARWVRGHEFPVEYRYPRYVVYDWNGRHLRRPPSGYVWYRADDDYVLVRKRDNLIEDIIDALD